MSETGPGEAVAPPRDGLQAVARFIAIAGGVVLLACAAMVTVSVLGRWAGSGPVPGDFELVQYATAILVFASFPFTQIRRGHIIVDTFSTRWPRWLVAGVDALFDLVYAAIAAFIAWRLAVGALEAWSSETTSMMLALPIAPVIGITAALAAFLGLVALVTAVRLLGKPRAP